MLTQLTTFLLLLQSLKNCEPPIQATTKRFTTNSLTVSITLFIFNLKLNCYDHEDYLYDQIFCFVCGTKNKSRID